MDEYDDIAREQKGEYLRSSLYSGARQQPDIEAKIQALSERVGVPVDVVRRKRLEVELHDKLKSFDYEKVIKESPKLSSWLAEPNNAAVAHDDISNLSTTEQMLTLGRDYSGAFGQGVIGQGAGASISGFGELYGVAARTLERGLDVALPKQAMDVLRTPIPWWLDPEKILKRQGGSLKAIGEAIAPPKERQTLGTDVASGIGQLGFQIAAFLYSGGTSSTAMMFSQGADIMAEKTAKDIADPGLRDTAILTGGAITALTERYGLDKILNRVPPAIRNRTLRFIADKVAAGGIEAAQEFTEGLLHDVARRVLTNKDAELLQGVEREMSAAALSAAIVRSVLGVRGHMQAKQTEDFVKALAEDSKSSKLRERLPERYRDLIAKYTADGPVQQVMIPSEQFTEYFQSVDIDPMQAASDFGAVNFAEAVATGGDVVIPMADFVTKIAPTDHLQGLLQDLRLLPDELTARESKAADANREDSDKQLLADIEEINKVSRSANSLDTAIQRIVSDVEGQLSQRYDKQTANHLATAMRGVAVLAQRANPDADPLTAARALWDRYGLTVNAMAEDGQAVAEKSFNQSSITDNESFHKWFGDSKVVDADGKPLVVYHGTASDFNVFDKKKIGSNYRQDKKGFFFAGQPQEAGFAADDASEKQGSPNVMPVYLSMRNPMELHAPSARGFSASGWLDNTDKKKIMTDAANGKHDGIIVRGSNGDDVYIAFKPEQIKSAIGNKGTFDPSDPNILNQLDGAGGTHRGSITIGKDRKININLFEDANLSTFLHETGHFYLEVMSDLAQDEGTSQQVKDDFAKILKFLGVENANQIKVEHHEKWARANEAYFMEGKAPSQELRGVFQRFGAWLKFIYKQLAQLNVKLNDDVRGVLDRIYATDEEIARAKEEAGLNALFVDAEAAGMTDAEFKIYSDAVAQEVVDGKEALQNQLMRIERLKRESWWKDERAKVSEEVATEFDATPTAQAFNRLIVIDGEERLNKDQLTERFGEDVVNRLPRGYGEGRGAVYAEDGQDIDSIAEVLGYSDANGLIDALVNMPNRAQYIATEADARMGQRHGDLLNSIAIADAAMEALHNDQREKVLRMELRALNKKARDVKPFVKMEKDKAAQMRREAVAATELPAAQAFRDIARGLVGQKQVRDLNAHSYLVAERKANRAAFKAMAKGDHREAQEQKRRELLNHHIYREAIATKQELEKNVAYLRSMQSDNRRSRIGKAGGQYLSQIDALLERYEFKSVSQVSLQRREALQAWVKEQENEGEAISIPDEILDESRRINWKQASVDELRALTDSVKNIEHLAGLKNKLLVKKKALDFERVKTEMLDAIANSSLKSTGELGIVSMRTANLKQKGAATWRKFDAAHMKVEQIVEWLDGGKIDGPWARYFFDLADNAQTTEYDLHAEVTKKIEDMSSGMTSEWRHSLSDRTNVRLPGFKNAMKRYDLISAALNLGNAQNRQRLMDGYGWSDADIQNIIGSLTVKDLEFVQGIWDSIETLWPHMADIEKRLSGLEPEKVAAAEFEAAGRTWRGGYFPLVYDPKKSKAGEHQANEVESVQNFVAQGYGRVATNKGATKKRLEKLNAPVLLDYEQVITSHLSKVIKDISHREAVIGITKILKDQEIKSTLIDRLGEAHYKELNNWMQTLIKDRADSLHQASGLGGIFMKTRTNMAIVTMGWKISTMFAQFAGIGQTLDIVKPRFFSKALIESVNAPRETWAFITQRSGEMRHRSNTIERDARDALLRMRGEVGVTSQIRRTAFYLTAMADRAISTPTWLGAYKQALADGLNEDDAIRAGDRAVRLSQGAGGAKDLAAVQRNNELMKLITMYYSPFNVLYARLRDIGHQGAMQGIGYLPKALSRLLALVVIPAVLGEILGNRGPDDDEDEVWWAARKSLLYPLSSVPVIRDFSGHFEAAIINATGEGEMKYPPNYKLSPIVSAIEKLSRVPGKIGDAIEGQAEPSDVAWDVFETSGYITGLPTSQTRITGEYLIDLLSGDEEPENVPELLRDAVFRRPKE
jgi:hypothetical protein